MSEDNESDAEWNEWWLREFEHEKASNAEDVRGMDIAVREFVRVTGDDDPLRFAMAYDLWLEAQGRDYESEMDEAKVAYFWRHYYENPDDILK